MIIRYSIKGAPVPKGWRFEPLTYHYDPEAGYGILIKEDENAEPMKQILMAVYDDGMLVTTDGESSFRHMTKQQMLWLAQELIEKAAKDD
jgi:hypothetical protein